VAIHSPTLRASFSFSHGVLSLIQCFKMCSGLVTSQLETCGISVHPVWEARYRPVFNFPFRTLMFWLVKLFSTRIFLSADHVFSRRLRISS
jgi:sulfite exporter TauE/SafE